MIITNCSLPADDVTCQEADATDAPASDPVSDAGNAGDTSGRGSPLRPKPNCY